MPEQSSNNHNQNTLSYLGKLGSNLLDSIIRRFSNPETARRNRFILLATTALFLTLTILPSQHLSTISYKTGDIATSDIRATQDQLVEDRALTEQRRKEAGNGAAVVYNLNDRVQTNVYEKLEQSLTAIRADRPRQTEMKPADWQKLLVPILETELKEPEIQALTRIKSTKAFLASASTLLNDLYQRRIVLDGKVFQNDARRGVEIADNNGHTIGGGDMTTSFTDIGDARVMVRQWRYNGLGDASDNELISAVISRILLPNLFYNREASEARVKTAMETVRPVLFKLQKGEMIVRVGERITPEQAHKLQAIFGEQQSGNRLLTAIGTFSLIIVLFYFPYRFACKNIRKFNPSNKDILIISLLITGSFLSCKTSLLISHNIGPVFPSIETTNYFYLFPFAAGAMIVRIFINSEVALVYCAALAPLLGIMFENNMLVVIYSLLGSIVGAHGVRHCTSRGTIYAAGLKVTVVNLAMALSFQTFNNAIFTTQTVYVAFFAVLSGIISAGLVSGFVPVIETLFQYTTDIKLLELANLNSPVLRELMIKAPGTYHHSVVVGNLVEAAAESINANPLLARVAAYYHDIGKASKAHYFIENQGGEENRHDKLAPSMSALILISHIKEGAELAREKRIGQQIIDIIRQHHGTGLIKFFYERAKAQAEISGNQIDEKDFRYPGPKPQTREAGIVMLADCVEAASRTLVNPTPDRIQGMVQKLINNVFIDGQLDECELTLKNLHEIAKSFNRILNGIFHHRIDYPDPVHKGGGSVRKVEAHDISNRVNGDSNNADTDEQSPETPSLREPPVKKGSGENLKRLGMS
ncbi:MAG: HD family phosphohydrolase [Geobacteraceae bacterium GWC2_55_20]|nr:MAG: HD family phosphohydrolase [Geobacteraceae bacterium GWC2_55_20]OGU20535.1 MAG: HD family phosphohydrolase [Geobacteraceae bacterium GWF2_54_21]HBA73233.1 HD family phosphohydrolase [Geobacter sp.]HCE68931.1 HD family phosphohydrolase [Geobacter sp.]